MRRCVQHDRFDFFTLSLAFRAKGCTLRRSLGAKVLPSCPAKTGLGTGVGHRKGTALPQVRRQSRRSRPNWSGIIWTSLRILALLAATLCSLPLCGAHSSPKPPLVISNVSQQGSVMTFDLTNVSQKGIRADVIACTLSGANGQRQTVTLQQTAIYGLGPDVLAPLPFDAGVTHQEHFGGLPRNPNGQTEPCALSVDYVLFTDGSAWGPDTRNASLDIRGVISGYDQAIMGLQRKLNQGGTDAVLQYIRQFKPIR
jgi:hypothetical protein